jgi:hypothetical protein
VLAINCNQVRIGIDAPRQVAVHGRYLWNQSRSLSTVTFAGRDSSTAQPVALVLTFPRTRSWHATAATQPIGMAGLCTSKKR